MRDDDVVVAVATPWGRSALGMVRLTGPGDRLGPVLHRVLRPFTDAPLRAGGPRRVRVLGRDGVLDDGVLLWRAGPRTATGEDLAELTLHGNPVVLRAAVDRFVAAGARPAGPGDFTRRAFLHGRLDRLGAEAVLQTIAARTLAGVRAARAGLDGRLADAVDALRSRLLEATAEVEARLDHFGDGLNEVDDDTLRGLLRAWAAEARALAADGRRGATTVHGAQVALVGEPNAGKSSLFNALLGEARALVHPSAGTTRDVVEGRFEAGGVEVTLLDTAGDRTTDDPLEQAGVARAREVSARVDGIVVVLRARPGGPSATERDLLARTAGRPRVVVLNGVDGAPAAEGPPGALRTVAPRGEGVDAVRDALVAALVGQPTASGLRWAAGRDQAAALDRAAEAAEEAAGALGPMGPAVASVVLHEALEALDGLTGADTREDVLDAIFARFCVGK